MLDAAAAAGGWPQEASMPRLLVLPGRVQWDTDLYVHIRTAEGGEAPYTLSKRVDAAAAAAAAAADVVMLRTDCFLATQAHAERQVRARTSGCRQSGITRGRCWLTRHSRCLRRGGGKPVVLLLGGVRGHPIVHDPRPALGVNEALVIEQRFQRDVLTWYGCATTPASTRTHEGEDIPSKHTDGWTRHGNTHADQRRT